MNKKRKQAGWRIHMSSSKDDVQFSIRGQVPRRTAWIVLAFIILVACALIAPDVIAEIARLLKSISP